MKRLALASLLATCAATSALAQGPTPERLVDADQVFPMIDKFYATPPADRSTIALAYVFTHEGKPATGVHLALVVNGKRTPLAIEADGRVERLPTPAEMAAHAQVAVDAPKGYFNVRLNIRPSIRPAQEIDAAQCALAITQLNAAIKRAAGLLALAAPQVKVTTFPGAGSGVAVMGDGKTTPLPLLKGAPVYDPAAIKGAKTIRLAKVPIAVGLE
jgi:hypothetical protein